MDVRDLVKRYPSGTVALDGVNVQVWPGEFVVVLGANGSGKSTLLRCAARLTEITGGNVLAAGNDLSTLSGAELRTARRAVAMVFQQSNLVRRRSVWDNVLAGTLARHHDLRTAMGMPPRGEDELVAALLAKVGMVDHAAQRADTLSGGQAQRVSIARALAQTPQVLLADEPVSGLDPDAVLSVVELLTTLAHRDRLAVLCVLHQTELALTYADRIVALRGGRVVRDGPPETFDPSTLLGLYRDSNEPAGSNRACGGRL